MGLLDKRHDYRACSLAHRSLTNAAQRELHRTVQFTWNENRVRRGHSTKDETKYSTPDIAAFVRELRLNHLPSPRADKATWAIMARFTPLTTLSIYSRNDWRYITREDRDTLHRTFPNVDTLALHSDYFYRAEDFLFFLTAFPNITALVLEDSLSFFMPSSVSATIYPVLRVQGIPCPLLRVLNITNVQDSNDIPDAGRLLEQWIIPLSLIAEPGFKLIWYQDVFEEPTVFPQFVKALAPVLGSLKTTFIGNAPSSTCISLDQFCDISFTSEDICIFIADFGTRNCNELRSVSFLGLCESFDDPDRTRSDGDAWVLNVLHHLTSTHLEVITLEFAAESVEELDMLDLSRVDALLSQPRFSRVQVLLIPFLTGYMRVEEVRQTFLRRMLESLPKLCANEKAEIALENGEPRHPLKTFSALLASSETKYKLICHDVFSSI